MHGLWTEPPFEIARIDDDYGDISKRRLEDLRGKFDSAYGSADANPAILDVATGEGTLAAVLQKAEEAIRGA